MIHRIKEVQELPKKCSFVVAFNTEKVSARIWCTKK